MRAEGKEGKEFGKDITGEMVGWVGVVQGEATWGPGTGCNRDRRLN